MGWARHRQTGQGFAITGDDSLYIGDTDGRTIWKLQDGKVVEEIGGLQARPHNIVWDLGTSELYFANTLLPGQINKVIKK